MSTHVDAPPPRDIGKETQDTLASQIALAPQQLAAYQATAPGYAATDVNILGQSLFGPQFTGNLSDINQQLSQLAAQQSAYANTAQRTANIADVTNLGGQVQGALQSANQPFYNQLASFTNLANSPIQQSAQQQQFAQMAGQGFGSFDPSSLYANTNQGAQQVGTNFSAQQIQAPNSYLGVNAAQGNPLLNYLGQKSIGSGQSSLLDLANQQAQAQLALGGQLSPDQLRAVQQSSRAGFAARGLDATNASVVDEALQTQAAQQAMYQQRLANAQAIEAQNQGQQQLQNQLGLGASSQALGYGQLGLSAQQANQSAYQALNQMGLAAQQANQGSNLQAQGLGLQAQTANQSAALQAQQQQLQAQLANQNFGLGSYQANVASQAAQMQALQQSAAMQEQQRLSQLSGSQAALGAQSAAFFDPFQGVLGGQSSNVGNNQQLIGNAGSLTGQSNAATMNMFNPFNTYSQDLYNTNYNGQAAANIATGNNRAAIIGGSLQALGNIFGGMG